MRLNEYQRGASRTSHTRTSPWATPAERLAMASLWLASEAGEVCSDVRRHIAQEDGARARIADELGDVLWCVAEVATLLGLDLEHCASLQRAKQEARYASIIQLHDTEGPT